MRGDLRRVLWRLRAGVVRRAALEAAVEEACSSLVESRFREPVALQEVSQFARPFLVNFETQVSMARLLALEGRYRSAVRAVEGAEAALAAARGLAEAHAAWEGVVTAWRDLADRFDLAPLAHLATLREGARGLAVAEEFLRGGESRKARFVVRQCRVFLDRLTAPPAGQERLRILARRLVDRRRTPAAPPDSLVRLLGRIADDGRLELAERLLDDWEMEVEAGGIHAPSTDARASRVGEELNRMTQIEKEARSLARELASMVPDRAGREMPSGRKQIARGIEKED